MGVGGIGLMDDWNLPPILVSKNKFETTEYDGPVLPVLLFVAVSLLSFIQSSNYINCWLEVNILQQIKPSVQ